MSKTVTITTLSSVWTFHPERKVYTRTPRHEPKHRAWSYPVGEQTYEATVPELGKVRPGAAFVVYHAADDNHPNPHALRSGWVQEVEGQ